MHGTYPGRWATLLSASVLTLSGAYALGLGIFFTRDLSLADPIIARIEAAAAAIPSPPPEPALGYTPSPQELALLEAAEFTGPAYQLLSAGAGMLVTLGAVLIVVAAIQWLLWYRIRQLTRRSQAV